MTNRSSIADISALMDGGRPEGTGGDDLIARIATAYPYFIPAKYIAARSASEGAPFSNGIQEQIRPYLGNWLLFCDFIQKRIAPDAADEDIPVTEHVIEVEAETITITDNEVMTVDESVTAWEDMPIIPVVAGLDAARAEEGSQPDEELLIAPVFTIDYFLHKGERVSDDIPAGLVEQKAPDARPEDREKALMVMMSFTEWLLHFKSAANKKLEEIQDQKALKTMWQKEKLAAALEAEDDEIPENVLEMAVNSISMEAGLASETLADLYIKQGKYDHAIDMYRKLSLRNPQKSAYFARKIEEAIKDKQL